MKHKILLLYFSVALLYFNPMNAQEFTTGDHLLTLEDIWSKVELNNKELKAGQLNIDKGDERLKAAKDDRLPMININGNYSQVSNMPVYENGLFHTPRQNFVVHEHYQFGAETALNLYNGGKTNLNIKIKSVENDLNTHQQHLLGNTIKLKATIYYFELFKNSQFKLLIEQEITSNNSELKKITDLYKNGIVLKSDVLRAEVKISNQKMVLSEIENNIAIYTQQLNILMGNPDDSKIELDTQSIHLNDPFVLSSYEDYVALALKNSDEYKISDVKEKLSLLNLKQVKSNILPTISLFSNYNYTYPQGISYPYAIALYGYGQVGLKMSVPISNLYLNKHRREEASIAYTQQKMGLEIKFDEIRQNVNAAYLHYTDALKRIETSQKNIIQSTESLRILKNSYFNQQSLLTDLLDAETQLLQSKFDLTSAQVNAQVQYYQLLSKIGIL
ncbi:TolC family protein [Flavobacterium sp. '19STA2R22 D10 B1']|uniref:TolC family protein n=1 Tax=Flavobacterium aerium TaxID=3037261 RepID=UPI00278C25E3|nr:TolC family protein [Flavobacterium sp. '19STA2R22 D10 B1']